MLALELADALGERSKSVRRLLGRLKVEVLVGPLTQGVAVAVARLDCLTSERAKLLVGDGGVARDAKDDAPGARMTAPVELVQRRKQLASREVARRAEDHEDAGGDRIAVGHVTSPA